MTIWLAILFVFKLIELNKAGKNKTNNRQLLDVATKTAILCCMSAIAYMTNMLAVPFLIYRSVYEHFVWQIILFIDIYSSFLCVYLSYDRFHAWYKRLCRQPHRCCLFLCNKCFGKEEIKTVEKLKVSSTASGPPTVIKLKSPSKASPQTHIDDAVQNV